MSGLHKLSMSSPDASKTCTCLADGFDNAGTEPTSPSTSATRPRIPPAKPSLLSQTAPHDLHDQKCPANDPQRTPSPEHAPPLATPPSPPPPTYPISVKIADLGNATPSRRHYTEDIQTRQYRSPEAIIGRTDWGCNTDVWSVACVVFELLTAEYLFDPQSQGDVFGKDDDHMAQIIELLGDFEGHVKFGGRFSRDIFDSTGASLSVPNAR